METIPDQKIDKPQPIVSIIHQNTVYKVSKKQFSTKSKIFSFFDSPFCTRFILPDFFDTSAVQSLIKFIETTQVRVKVEKSIEFIALTEILGCERITNKTTTLISSVPKEEILTQYISLLTNNTDSFAVEKIIILNMVYFLKYKKELLMKVPINKLAQLIQKSIFFEKSELNTNSNYHIDMSDLTYLCSNLIHEYGNQGLLLSSVISFDKVSDESLSNLAWELQFIEQTPQVSLIINLSSVRESKETELKKVWNYLYYSVVSPSSKDDPKLAVASMLQSGKYLPQNSREYTNIILGLIRNKNPKAQYIYSQMLLQPLSKNGDNTKSEENFAGESFKSTFSLQDKPASSTNNSNNITSSSSNSGAAVKSGDIIATADLSGNPYRVQRRMSQSSSSPNLSSNASPSPTNSQQSHSIFSAFAAASITPLGAASVALSSTYGVTNSNSVSAHPPPMTPEEKEAFRYLKMSADKNYEPAILKLSEMIIKDRSLLKTRGMLKYIQKAALLGDSNAELVLGIFYRDGINVKQDIDIAKELFGLSAYHQNVNGLVLYVKLNNSMNKRLFFLLISTGNIELVSAYLALDHTAINCLDFQCWSVAHYAVFSDYEQTEMIEYLYNSFNVDLECVTITGAKPIHLACLKGNLKAVKFLLQNGNPKSIHAMTYKKELPIHFACKSGNNNLVNFLLEECNCKNEIFRKTFDNWTCLHYACECGSHFIVRELLRYDTSHTLINSLNNNKETPLHLACKSGNIILVSKLLKIPGVIKQFFAAQTNKKANVLHYACLSGNQKIINFVFNNLTKQYGLSILDMRTTLNENILFYACLSGNVKAVDYVIKLLGKRNDFDAKNIFHETLMHYACKSGSDELVAYLKKRHDFEISDTNIVFYCAFFISFLIYIILWNFILVLMKIAFILHAKQKALILFNI